MEVSLERDARELADTRLDANRRSAQYRRHGRAARLGSQSARRRNRSLGCERRGDNEREKKLNDVHRWSMGMGAPTFRWRTTRRSY